MSDVARTGIVDLDTETVAKGLEDDTILIVDVREPYEFAAGHIPGAVSLPLSEFDPAEIPTDTGKRIVFSCAAGVRSAKALQIAQAAGLDLHEHYIGGFRGWTASGGDIE